MSIEGFDPNVPVERAWTPPATWYTSPEVAAWERHTVFRDNWIAVGRADQVAEPGDYFAGVVAEEPFVAVRGEDGVLRAFYNVCRHHATCVAEGAGRTESLVCPYHGWTYDLDGRLRSARLIGAIKDFERDSFGLVPMKATEWRSIVFVCQGEPPEPIESRLGVLDERLEPFGTAHLHFVARQSYEVACNWKVFADNYLDGGYHIATLHPWLDAELDMETYRIEAFGGFSIQSSSGRPAQGIDRMGSGALYAYVYPNLFINRYGPIMDLNLVFPLDPNRCLVLFDYYFAQTKGEGAERFIEESMARSEAIQQEDGDICERVQRGLRSSSYDRGRYAPSLEHAMHHFHCLLASDLSRAQRGTD